MADRIKRLIFEHKRRISLRHARTHARTHTHTHTLTVFETFFHK